MEEPVVSEEWESEEGESGTWRLRESLYCFQVSLTSPDHHNYASNILKIISVGKGSIPVIFHNS